AQHVRAHVLRAAVGVALAVLLYLLFPSAPVALAPLYDVGSIAPEAVVAPLSFAVPKPAAALAAERAEAAAAVAPVFVRRPEGLDSAHARLAALDSALAGAPSAERLAAYGVRLTAPELALVRDPRRLRAAIDSARQLLDAWLPRGVVQTSALRDVRGPIAVVERGSNGPRPLAIADADSVVTFATFLARAARPSAADPAATLRIKLLSASFAPTLVADQAETDRRREAAARTVPATRGTVRAGERIIGAREVVGRDEYERLRALRAIEQQRASTTAGAHVARVIGAVLHNLVLLVIVGVVLFLFRPTLYASFRAVALFALVFAAVALAAAAVGRWGDGRAEFVPIAFAAMLFSTLFDARISLVAITLLAVLLGGQGPFRGTNATYMLLVAGTAAAVSVRTARRRSQAFVPVLVVAAGYTVAAITLGLALGSSWIAVALIAAGGTATGLASVVVGMAVLPLAEDFTGVDTYLRLLEWSDLNRPLLRRLAVEAPGTFAHTIAMANLVESACNAIGANGLLGRVGTYYHDIGKLERPQYFVENQGRGRNPHDKLKPSASAAIIRGHVREGLALADEYKLPNALRSFITQHHGTNRIVYFYERARERGDASPTTAEYAYGGPLPNTAETAVCMLADGVEAAARALPEPTQDRIRALVERIVQQRLEQGQLRDAPLTLRQLETVKEEFARVLLGMYHGRIDYPPASTVVTGPNASMPNAASNGVTNGVTNGAANASSDGADGASGEVAVNVTGETAAAGTGERA
ncbi:MAG TPA: HDIG domain-containing protein, partial [Gemmatirosa sp.]